MSGPRQEPRGFVHVKDLLYRESPPRTSEEWARLARPCLALREDTTLEAVLVELQRHHQQMALVFDEKGAWTGLVTLEDVIEKIIGDVGDEFATPSPELPALTPERVTMTLNAETLEGAEAELVGRTADHRAPLHVGHGVAVVATTDWSARRPGLRLGRSESGVSLANRDDRIHLVFALVLPSDSVSMQREFATAIAASVESDYVRERMMSATDPEEIVEVFRDGLCVA